MLEISHWELLYLIDWASPLIRTFLNACNLMVEKSFFILNFDGRQSGMKAVWCWQISGEKAGWWLSKLFLRIQSVWDICGFSAIFSSDNFQSNLHLELKSSLPGKRSQTSFKKTDGEAHFSVTTFILQSVVLKIDDKFLAILVDLTYLTFWSTRYFKLKLVWRC